MQYWAQGSAPGFADGDPDATAEDGWAAFKTPEARRCTALVGESVVFSVAATGRPVPAYHWSFNGEDVVGAANPTLILSDVSFEDQGAYAVTVSNEAGTMTTNAALLTVTPLSPAFVAQPEALAIPEGSTAAFSAAVAGLAPLEFKWSRNGVDLADDERVEGSDTGLRRARQARRCTRGRRRTGWMAHRHDGWK